MMVVLLAAEAVEVHTAIVAAIVARTVVPVAIVGRVVVMTHTIAAANDQAHRAIGIMMMMLKHSATQQRQSERQGHRYRLHSCFHIAKLTIIFEITPLRKKTQQSITQKIMQIQSNEYLIFRAKKCAIKIIFTKKIW